MFAKNDNDMCAYLLVFRFHSVGLNYNFDAG